LDALRAGRWLEALELLPDRVICPPARRTRETLALVSGVWSAAPPVEYDERVYAAGVAGLLAVVRGAPPSARSVMIVGHNPGMQALTIALAGDEAAQGDIARVAEKYPTCAIAVRETPGAWSAFAPGGARLTRFAVPREF
jgi:phosphohistidine phosphatase